MPSELLIKSHSLCTICCLSKNPFFPIFAHPCLSPKRLICWWIFSRTSSAVAFPTCHPEGKASSLSLKRSFRDRTEKRQDWLPRQTSVTICVCVFVCFLLFSVCEGCRDLSAQSSPSTMIPSRWQSATNPNSSHPRPSEMPCESSCSKSWI